MPVVVQPTFRLKPLSGETHIQRGRPGDTVRLPEWQPDRVPYRRLGAVRHLDGAIKMIGVNEPELRCRRVDVGNDRDRHVVEPDIFPGRYASSGCLRNNPARAVLDGVNSRRGPARNCAYS